MIIDIDLREKTVLVVGGGRQAELRTESLLQDRCGRIVVASARVSSGKILRWAGEKAIRLDRRDIRDESFVDRYGPDMVIAATDDAGANAMAVRAARARRILAYRSDESGGSDFSHPSLIRLGGGVTVAISTGGRSPAVSKYVRQKAEPVLCEAITERDIAMVRIQDEVRRAARRAIPGAAQSERKALLDEIMSDGAIDRLIRDGRVEDAKERAMSMLGDRM